MTKDITDGTKKVQTASGDEFTIVVIPDTQYYMENNPDIPGATFNMFKAQVDWIKANQAAENIVYVAGVGDIVDNGDFKSGEYPDSSATSEAYQEWQKAKYYYNLETPFTGHPDGIPYGLAVGNHDQTGHGYPLTYTLNGTTPTTHTTGFYNRYFGVSHFSGKSYWGGSYTTTEANNNDSHYDLFTAGGVNFIVIYLEYDQEHDQYGTQLEDWAYSILGTYSTRKAIVVMHALNPPNPANEGTNLSPAGWYTGAKTVYERIKSRKNVFLMLGGHTGTGANPYAEGYRQDTYNGSTIKCMTANYQWQTNGGNGFFRLLKFSVANDLISVKTYSPFTNTFETDGDSQFSVPLFRQPTAVRKEDFNNNGSSEFALFNMGTWKIDGMSNVTYGTMAGDWPIQSDYDGDGKADIGVYRTSNFTFNVPALSGSQIAYGSAGDIPVPADYNGDGRSGIALYRPSDGSWHIPELQSTSITYGGYAGDIPVPADYDGDGKVDLAIYRPGTSATYNLRNVYCCQITLGGSNSIPVPGDYNGDGIADLGAFNKSTGVWELRTVSADLPDISAIVTPVAGDIPVPDDYFGLGKIQPAIYRPSTNTLYMYNNGTVTSKVIGSSGDKPVNLPYHIRKFFFP